MNKKKIIATAMALSLLIAGGVYGITSKAGQAEDDVMDRASQIIDAEKIYDLYPSVASPQTPGSEIVFMPNISLGDGLSTFQYTAYRGEGKTPYYIATNSDNTGTWIPTATGKYEIVLKITDSNGEENTYSIPYVIKNERKDFKITNIRTYTEDDVIVLGREASMDVSVEGGSEEYSFTYGYIDQDGKEVISVKDTNSSSFILPKPFRGDIVYFVIVKDVEEGTTLKEYVRRRISGCEITGIDTSLISPAALGETISFNFNTKYEVDYRNTNKYIIKIYNKKTNEKVLSLSETKYTLGNLKWTPNNEGSYRIDASVYSTFSGETEPYSFDFDIVKNAGDEVTIYYKGFSEPYIHYALDNNWTSAPGVKMSKYQYVTYTHVANVKLNGAKELVCCFNDGNNNWDSNNGNNYTFKPGKYLYSEGEMMSLNGRAKLSEEKIVIYYNGYDNPNIHYALRGNWTSVPGVPMEKSDVEGYAYKAEIDVTGDETLTCCFNDGNGNWDNNNYQNYTLTKGIYYVNNGTLTKK